MRRIFIITVALLAASVSVGELHAQTFRVEAGYLQPVRRSNHIGNQHLNGIRVGGTVDFELPKVNFLSIHTGLFYTFAFGNDSQRYYFSSYSDSIRIRHDQSHFLDIPVHVVASYKLFKNKVTVFGFAGPNFNIGLYQKQTIETTITDEGGLSYLEELGHYVGSRNLYPERLRRFNLQLEVGGGIEWWRMQVKGGYSFGINNISKVDISRERQSGWFVSTAYTF